MVTPMSMLGKERWCDKSLINAPMAELIFQIWPKAQFICLFRHCMDVVNSAIEASPWGLSSYGFMPFAIGNPGNSVLALVKYWVAYTTSILDFETTHPDSCHRVYYEELVATPSKTMEGVGAFLGLEPDEFSYDPSTTSDYDQRWAGDHKVWYTSDVHTDSVNAGLRIPSSLISPQMLNDLNEILERLGYRQVDEHWGSVDVPPPKEEAADRPLTPEAMSSTSPAGIEPRGGADGDRKERSSTLGVLKLMVSRTGTDEMDFWYIDFKATPAQVIEFDEASSLPSYVVIASDSTIKALALTHDDFGSAFRQRKVRLFTPDNEEHLVDVDYASVVGRSPDIRRIAEVLSTDLIDLITQWVP
jgi:hypothetical protein